MTDSATIYQVQRDALSVAWGGGMPMSGVEKCRFAVSMLRAAKEAGATPDQAWHTLEIIVRETPGLSYNQDDYNFIKFAASGIF